MNDYNAYENCYYIFMPRTLRENLQEVSKVQSWRRAFWAELKADERFGVGGITTQKNW